MREYVWCSTVQMDELLEITKDNHELLADILFGALKLSESAEDEDKAFFDYVQQKIDERRGMNEQKQTTTNKNEKKERIPPYPPKGGRSSKGMIGGGMAGRK